jgi:hypothetical protein
MNWLAVAIMTFGAFALFVAIALIGLLWAHRR